MNSSFGGMESFSMYQLCRAHGWYTLLFLITVAAQALLALVRGYLMAFTFLTARHNFFVLKVT